MGCLPRELRERSTVDDLREVMAYYKMQAEDRALELWQNKMDEIQKKKERQPAPKTLGSRR